MTAPEFFSKDDERKYARGWPHAIVLEDGHPHDKKPLTFVAKTYKHYLGAYHAVWPREVAACFARAMSVSEPEWPVRFEQTPERVDAMKRGAPIDASLAKRTFSLHVVQGGRWAPDMQEHVLFVLEAFAGTDAVLGLLVDALEALPKSRWKGDAATAPAYYAYLAGYLLLRASPAVAKAQRARLESLHDATVAAKIAIDEHTLRGGLDLGLHGDLGAGRVLPTSHWQYLHWYGFVTDASVLRARLANSSKAEWNPDARHVYTCGTEMLGELSKPKVTRKTAKWRASWLRDLGMFKDDAVVRLMVESVGDKNAGTLPVEWMRAHADWAVPRVERIARADGASAQKAKAALAALEARP